MYAKTLITGAMVAMMFAAGCSEKVAKSTSEHDAHAGHGHGPVATGESSSSSAETVAGKAQTTCPVMGGKINSSIYADHNGKRVYFCCNACISPFRKDPEKFIKKLEDAGVTVAEAPAGSTGTSSAPGHDSM